MAKGQQQESRECRRRKREGKNDLLKKNNRYIQRAGWEMGQRHAQVRWNIIKKVRRNKGRKTQENNLQSKTGSYSKTDNTLAKKKIETG